MLRHPRRQIRIARPILAAGPYSNRQNHARLGLLWKSLGFGTYSSIRPAPN